MSVLYLLLNIKYPYYKSRLIQYDKLTSSNKSSNLYLSILIHPCFVRFQTPFFCVPTRCCGSPSSIKSRNWLHRPKHRHGEVCRGGRTELTKELHLWRFGDFGGFRSHFGLSPFMIHLLIVPNKKPPAIGNPQDFRKRPFFSFAERINELKWEIFHRSPGLVTAGSCHMCCYRCKNRDF